MAFQLNLFIGLGKALILAALVLNVYAMASHFWLRNGKYNPAVPVGNVRVGLWKSCANLNSDCMTIHADCTVGDDDDKFPNCSSLQAVRGFMFLAIFSGFAALVSTLVWFLRERENLLPKAILLNIVSGFFGMIAFAIFAKKFGHDEVPGLVLEYSTCFYACGAAWVFCFVAALILKIAGNPETATKWEGVLVLLVPLLPLAFTIQFLIHGLSYYDNNYVFHDDGGFATSWSTTDGDQQDRVLNWHPLLMVLGFITIMSEGLLAFRVLERQVGWSRKNARFVHMGLQTLAVGVITFGYSIANKYKQVSGNTHLWSGHAWMGFTTLILMWSQWVTGVYSLYLSSSIPLRKAMTPLHVFLGVATYLGAFAAIQSGVTERQWWIEFSPQSPTWGNDNDHSFSNWGGVVIISTAITVFIVMWTYIRDSRTMPNKNNLNNEDGAQSLLRQDYGTAH